MSNHPKRPRGRNRRRFEPLSVSPDGVLTELIRMGDDEVIVHHDDIPDQDKTTVLGIPCTTALRTVIDLAPELDAGELQEMVDDFLGRGLFTVDEAWARLAESDMVDRSGAVILRRFLADRS